MELDRALLMELLVAEGLDAVLVGRPWDTTVQPTVSYLVGHLLPVWDYSGLFVLLRRTEPPIVIANAWCSPDPTGQLEVRTYPGHHMRFALPVLSATLQEVGLDHARIGIERTRLPVELFDEVCRTNPGVTFAMGDRVVARLRMRKSPAELAAIRGAIRVAEEAVRTAVAALTPGRSLAAIEAAVSALAPASGGRVMSAHFTSYRADGSELLDLPEQVQPGQPLVLDVIASHSGYHADLARQMVVGSPPVGLVERLERTTAIQEAMLQALHPGLSVADAYARTTEAAAPWCADDPSFVFQFHGIGWEIHEPPRFCSPNKPFFPLPAPGQIDDVPLEEQTVACLELGTGGAWIEDMVVFHATGYERLTTLPQTILMP